jgi:MtN3 and saliva related transmembrane protein
MYEVLGVVGTVILTGCGLPQLIRSYRTKSTGDLSLTYVSLLLIGMTCLLPYALHLGIPLFISSEVVGIALTLALLVMVLKWGRQASDQRCNVVKASE